MEGTPLGRLLEELETPTMVSSFTAPLDVITVRVYGAGGAQDIEVAGLAPFHTIEDIQRALWFQEGKSADLYPKYSFLGVQDESTGQFTSALGTFQQIGATELEMVTLADPIATVRERRIQDAFVDADGEKKPIRYNPRSRVTIDQVFLRPLGEVPLLHCFPLRYLRSIYPLQEVSQRDWYGLFYPYFPALENLANLGQMTARDAEQARLVERYITDKLEQVAALNTLVENKEHARDLKTSAVRLLTFQWIQTDTTFEGTDSLFFTAGVSAARPYMRLLPNTGTPMTKLFQPNPAEKPAVSDATLLRQWVAEPAPIANENFLFAKVVLQQAEFAREALYGTMMVMDDATARFTIQPPRGARAFDFDNELARLGQVLIATQQDMPFSLQEASLGRANISLQVRFDTPPKKEYSQVVGSRIKSLSTLFQEIKPPQEDANKPFLALRYKGVSNFKSESRMAAFLSYLFAREGIKPGTEGRYISDLAREFDITEEQAREFMGEYLKKNTDEFTVADAEGTDFLSLSNPGIDISLYRIDSNNFSVQLFNTQTVSMEDIQRIASIMSLVFYESTELWDNALGKQPVAVQQAARAAALAVEEEDEEEDNTARRNAVSAAKGGVALEFEDEDEGAAAAGGGGGAAEVPKLAAKPAPLKPSAATEKIVVDGWFITRLQELDKKLFDFPANKAMKISNYSTQCPNNWDRQPVVMTKAQYENMRQLYAKEENEGRVGFILYGDPSTKETIDKVAAQMKDNKRAGVTYEMEVFNVLRYGSSPANINYYICALYFCLRDVLPITKDDWDSDTDYNGETKQERSCPFCHGLLITSKDNPGFNETVLRRKPIPGGTKPHEYIGFLSKPKHPENYDLPCCFTKAPKSLEWADDKFKRIRQTAPATAGQVQAQAQQIQKRDIADATRKRADEFNYDLLRWELRTEYIVGFDRYPLEAGKVARPNPALDEFFGQNSDAMILRVEGQQRLKSSARGMFRIGAQNRVGERNWSLFSALAPALGRKGWREVSQALKEYITPRVFINLNFGNLVNEFYHPEDREPEPAELSTWITRYFGIESRDVLVESSRLYRSYHRFQAYLADSTQPKLLRHIAHVLAEPNIFVEDHGITIFTVEYIGQPATETCQVRIRSPMLGLDVARYANNHVVFLTLSEGIWEPLMYIDRILPEASTTAVQEGYYMLAQRQMSKPDFPRVIRERVVEFMNHCQSAYRGAFTLQRGVDNRTLLPLTFAVDVLKPTGLVRDIYNHIVAITVPSPITPNTVVLVPVVDDGNSYHRNTVLINYLGIANVRGLLAPANDVEQYYNGHLASVLRGTRAVYTLDSFINTDRIIAFRVGKQSTSEATQYESLITLPCADKTATSILQTPVEQLPEGEQFEFEYQLDYSIMTSTKEQDMFEKSDYILKKEYIENIYQHLRLTFSNWVAKVDGADMRRRVEELLGRNDLPAFEKRRRLQIQFERMILNWLAEDPNPFDVQPSLIRRDCIEITDPVQCTNMCSMKGGTCKIHTPARIDVSSTRKVDAGRYFTLRLFDELLRIPALRNELLTKGVRKIQVPSTNIHVGTSWILPENTPAWYELLRGGVETTQQEKPVFYEDFSRLADTNAAKVEATLGVYPVDDIFAGILQSRAFSKLGIQTFGRPEDRGEAVRILMQVFGLQPPREHPLDRFSENLLSSLSKRLGVPVVQVMMQDSAIQWIGISGTEFRLNQSIVVVIPNYTRGPAMFVLVADASNYIPVSFLDSSVSESIRVFKDRVKLPAPAFTTPTPLVQAQATRQPVVTQREEPAAAGGGGGGAAEGRAAVVPTPRLRVRPQAVVQAQQAAAVAQEQAKQAVTAVAQAAAVLDDVVGFTDSSPEQQQQVAVAQGSLQEAARNAEHAQQQATVAQQAVQQLVPDAQPQQAAVNAQLAQRVEAAAQQAAAAAEQVQAQVRAATDAANRAVQAAQNAEAARNNAVEVVEQVAEVRPRIKVRRPRNTTEGAAAVAAGAEAQKRPVIRLRRKAEVRTDTGKVVEPAVIEINMNE
jgi:hypothetical protein